MKLNYPLTSKALSLQKTPTDVYQSKLATVANCSAKLFNFKKSSKVILTTNVSIDDRLVNGQLGTIFDTKQDSSGILSKIYVKFEDGNTV